eukprot:GHVN01073051.1.p2 GENE.GHVN01073051.1~~GHVN01073051.1.p2  ORF type:complete len:302 (-),score=42.69 GHVN01073051.1:2708-3613(-)
MHTSSKLREFHPTSSDGGYANETLHRNTMDTIMEAYFNKFARERADVVESFYLYSVQTQQNREVNEEDDSNMIRKKAMEESAVHHAHISRGDWMSFRMLQKCWADVGTPTRLQCLVSYNSAAAVWDGRGWRLLAEQLCHTLLDASKGADIDRIPTSEKKLMTLRGFLLEAVERADSQSMMKRLFQATGRGARLLPSTSRPFLMAVAPFFMEAPLLDGGEVIHRSEVLPFIQSILAHSSLCPVGAGTTLPQARRIGEGLVSAIKILEAGSVTLDLAGSCVSEDNLPNLIKVFQHAIESTPLV